MAGAEEEGRMPDIKTTCISRAGEVFQSIRAKVGSDKYWRLMESNQIYQHSLELYQFAFKNRTRRRGGGDGDVHFSTSRNRRRSQQRYMNESELV